MENRWRIINNLLGRKGEDKDIEITDSEGNEIKDKNAANYLNSYFIEAGKSGTEGADMQYKNRFSLSNNFFYKNVTCKQIENIISEIKEDKATSDGYTVHVIKIIKQIVAKIMAKLINESIDEGKFPNALKESIVIPVLKSGDHRVASNYRPISLTSVFHRIFEKAILVQMWDFVVKFKLLIDDQYGFRKMHNTTYAILTFVNLIYGKINNASLIGMFLDLRKAYDSVEHEILLEKLYAYGFRGKIWNWLKDYLTNRVQIVKIGNCKSDKLQIKRGVLQGSTLGCLLFCLYINDVEVGGAKDRNLTLFADDTNILIWGKTLDESKNRANEELIRIDEWLMENKMTLNANKTKYMIFQEKNISNKSEGQDLYIKNNCLERVEVINFLGLLIDEKLNFKKHIEKTVKRLKQIIPYCYKLRDKLNIEGKKMFYYTMIYSAIQYGIEVYSNTTWTNLKILNNMHKKMIKILFCMPKRTNTVQVYTKLEILDLKHIIMLQLVKLGFKWAHNILPSKLQYVFSSQGKGKATRQEGCIYKKLLQTVKEQRIIDYRVSRYWNILPVNIRSLPDKKFKRAVKMYYLRQIETRVKGEVEDKYY